MNNMLYTLIKNITKVRKILLKAIKVSKIHVLAFWA